MPIEQSVIRPEDEPALQEVNAPVAVGEAFASAWIEEATPPIDPPVVAAPPTRAVRIWQQRREAVGPEATLHSIPSAEDLPLVKQLPAAPTPAASTPAAPAPTHFEPLFASISSSTAVLAAPELPQPQSDARMGRREQTAQLGAERNKEGGQVVPQIAATEAEEPWVWASPASAPWRNETAQAVRPSSLAETLRTGRWDPIPPLRAQAAPWRDRRVPGSDAHILPSDDRRFRPNVSAAHQTATPVRMEAVRPEPPAPVARPQLVQREPRLTRKWGLLSQFAEADPHGQAGRSDDATRTEAAGAETDTSGYRGDQRAAGGTRRT